MAATKEQERKVLEQIRKMVEELGTDSYIAMAFALMMAVNGWMKWLTF